MPITAPEVPTADLCTPFKCCSIEYQTSSWPSSISPSSSSSPPPPLSSPLHCRDLHFFQMLLYWIATTALPVQKPNSGSRVRRKVECQRLKQALTFGPQGGGSSSFVFVHAFNTTKGKSLKKVWVRVPCLLGQCKLWDNCDLFGKNRVVVLLLG